MLEALLATIIRPCLGQATNRQTPLAKEEANELFGTLRAEEILAINTAFREQLRVRERRDSGPGNAWVVLGSRLIPRSVAVQASVGASVSEGGREVMVGSCRGYLPGRVRVSLCARPSRRLAVRVATGAVMRRVLSSRGEASVR